jgi:hypothetical protein
VIIFVEYTIRQESDVASHLKNKKIIYDKINEHKIEFVEFFRRKFPSFDTCLNKKYQPHQHRVIILYCSLNRVKSEAKYLVSSAVYYDYNVAKYFDAVTKTVRKSSRFEIFDFLGLKHNDVAEGVLTTNQAQHQTYRGSILPETHSNF